MSDGCESCKFWRAPTESESMGECRRNAPAVNLWTPAQPVMTPLDRVQVPPTRAQWPKTLAADWCGEHEAPADFGHTLS